MSIAATMQFIWGTIANKQSTMLQTENGPARIESVRTTAGANLELKLRNGKLLTITPDNCGEIRSNLF